MKLYEVIVLETNRVKYFVEAPDDKTARENYTKGQAEESMPEGSKVAKVTMLEDYDADKEEEEGDE